MKIAVNTRLLLKNKMEGIGWFAFETLKRITRQHPEHHFYFIFDRPYGKEFVFSDNITPLVVGPPSRHPVLWYIWFNWSLAWVLQKIKPDVFVSPEGYICLNTNVKSLNVMHDIAYEHYPETVPGLVKKYYQYYFPRFARRARLIATVSRFSKDDIVKTYQVNPEKIRVVYNGCNEAYQPIPDMEKQAVRDRWAGGEPYFVYIGAINPRKNIKNLLLAFEDFKKSMPCGTRLLLIGEKGFESESLEALLASLTCKEDILFLGRIEDVKEVNRILAASLALTYISVFEGFGIPCLEAMRAGTAVITSLTSALPEVCGEAALYVDPHSLTSIADAMGVLQTDGDRRKALIEKGAIQAQKFSWQKTSELFWNAIMECAQSN